MATKKSVAMTPTKAPSNGVNCTSTAVEEAARHTAEKQGREREKGRERRQKQNAKSEIKNW